MANNAKANVEIPGYYWDSVSRRYFKEDQAHPRPPLAVNERVVELDNSPKASDLPNNVLDMLKKRELGFGSKLNLHSFEDFIIIRNLKHLKLIKELKPEPWTSLTDEVKFLKGGEHGIYVEMAAKNKAIYTDVKHYTHFFSPSKKSPTLLKCCQPSRFSTVDLCEGLNSTTKHSMFVSSDSNTWEIALWEITLIPGGGIMYDIIRPYISQTPIWCCGKNDFTEQFIFGKRNEIVMRAFRSNTPYIKTRIQGEVRSVQFDKQGHLIYAGLHTGHFEILDSRTNHSVYRTRLHNTGIDEIVPVFDERQLICGAFDGMLCNFDLRMREPLNEYFGHVHSPRKVPFSVNEPNNLLCATGLDNITRLWCLGKGGDPTMQVHPPEVGATCRSWLVSDGYKCLLYQYQNSNTYIYADDNFEFSPDSRF